MDWDKAKKIVIIMLFILNAGLFGLNYQKNMEYAITPSQEKAIFNVLANNGIQMYTQLVKRYDPMRPLNVKIPALETDTIKKMFFESDEATTITVEFNKTIIKSKSKTLTISNNQYQLLCEQGIRPIEYFTRETATQAAMEYIKKMGPEFEKYQLDSVWQQEGYYRFEFYEVYQKKKIFCSNLKLVLSEKGIISVSLSYYISNNFAGERMDICPADEALFTFMREIKHEKPEQTVLIEKMELGYDLQEKSEIAEGRQLKLIPCYHIYVAGTEKPYRINAYTNEIIRNS